jgi:hypothetical protein
VELSTTWGMIDARPIVFPAQAPALDAVTLVYAASIEPARQLVPGHAYEVVEARPGRVDVLVAIHEYRAGDWGPCSTCDLCIPVRPAGGAGPDGLYLAQALINSRFSGEIAYWSMGIPRRHATVDSVRTPHQVTFVAAEEGEPALTVRFPAARSDAPPTVYHQRAYSYLDGTPYATPFDIDFPELLPAGPDVEVEVGSGPFADALRQLGTAPRPEYVAWGTSLACTFHAPHPVVRPCP